MTNMGLNYDYYFAIHGSGIETYQLAEYRCIWAIGRNRESVDIYLDDPSVSRCHASIIKKCNPPGLEDCFMIYDGDIRNAVVGPSKNGVFINNRKIVRTAIIPPEAIVKLGENNKYSLILKKEKKDTDPNGTL